MASWGDKLITAVRFNSANTHIDQVRIGSSDGKNINTNIGTMTRMQVVSELKTGGKFSTAVETSSNQWSLGATVGIFQVKGKEYIKTKADNTETDNLDNLPRF